MTPRLPEGQQSFDFPQARSYQSRLGAPKTAIHCKIHKTCQIATSFPKLSARRVSVPEVTRPHEKRSNDRGMTPLTMVCSPSLSIPSPHLQKGAAVDLPLQRLEEGSK